MITTEVPALTICRAEPAPPLPAATDPDVTVWCDSKGVLGALSHVVDNDHWLHVLGVASFKLQVAQDAVVAFPWANADPDAITDEWQNTVWPTFLQIRGAEVLHASAVSTRSGVVAFCAASETGKSTLAYAVSQRGYDHWADDAIVLDVRPQGVSVQPLPFHIRLRQPSALHFGYSEARLRRGRVRREGRQKEGALPLQALCLLEGMPSLPDGGAVVIERAAPGQALTRVLQHAIYFSLQDPRRKRRMMEQYLSVVLNVPVFTVRFRRGLELLPSVVDAIEAQILHLS